MHCAERSCTSSMSDWIMSETYESFFLFVLAGPLRVLMIVERYASTQIVSASMMYSLSIGGPRTIMVHDQMRLSGHRHLQKR